MESYVNKRPWTLPAAVVPLSAVGMMSAADAVQLPPMHRVPAQAAFAQALVLSGSNETSGFAGEGIRAGKQRLDVRGIPPRGRPV